MTDLNSIVKDVNDVTKALEQWVASQNIEPGVLGCALAACLGRHIGNAARTPIDAHTREPSFTRISSKSKLFAL